MGKLLPSEQVRGTEQEENTPQVASGSACVWALLIHSASAVGVCLVPGLTGRVEEQMVSGRRKGSGRRRKGKEQREGGKIGKGQEDKWAEMPSLSPQLFLKSCDKVFMI